MVTGIIGKKVGMTQLFLEDGTLEPATVLQAGPASSSSRSRRRPTATTRCSSGWSKPSRTRNANKALTGHHKKANVPPTRVQREVKVAKGAEAPKPGDQVMVSIFNQGERVDVIGTSKGHGFQGVVKRHHFRGGDATHGSMFHRAPGSIGASSYPSRVMPGMRAHGHMGVRSRDGAQPEGAEDRLRESPDRRQGRGARRERRLRRDSQGRGREARAAAAAAREAQEGQEVRTSDEHD